MFDESIILISRTPTAARDPRGQIIYSETRAAILCEVVPVSRSEFFNGAQAGINPEFEFRINPIEYNGEKIVEYKGRRFSVYRTYQTDADTLEIYAEYVTGLNGGEL